MFKVGKKEGLKRLGVLANFRKEFLTTRKITLNLDLKIHNLSLVY